MSLLDTLTTGFRTTLDFGIPWAAKRLFYEAKLRSGWYIRALPARAWADEEWKHWLKESKSKEELFEEWKTERPAFFISAGNKEHYKNALNVLLEQDSESFDFLSSKRHISDIKFFNKLDVDISLPEDWFRNPFLEGKPSCKKDEHWSAYPMHGKGYIDLKFVWEYARFDIVYLLTRSYMVSGDEENAELFWKVIESWAEANPPNTGPHWKCGQEISLRLMAWCFGLYAFADSPATTADRFARLLGWIGAQADRVSKNTLYSHLQHSNHAISEGVGLYIAGLLFPQLKGAGRWKRMGKEILEERATFLIREDGTYIQKSHNYLRFILHAYLYVLCLAEANGETFSKEMLERVRNTGAYLGRVMDYESGKVPNFGSNDGALILPLNSCDFTDYRPVASAIHYYFYKERLFENGPWNEDLVWLFGPDALEAPPAAAPEMKSTAYEEGGIYTLRTENSWAFIHAESYKDRPFQADALHFDLWWKGINIALDAGTYLYFGNPPWNDALKHTHAHNTITIDDKDQLVRGLKFTWAYWHHCKVNQRIRDEAGKFEVIEFEHDGYERLNPSVLHKRSISRLGEDTWLIVDDVLGSRAHKARLHWLLADFPYECPDNQSIILNTGKGTYALAVHCSQDNGSFELVRGNEQTGTRGFVSRYYGYKEPALSFTSVYEGELPCRFISVFSPRAPFHFEKNADAHKKLVISINHFNIHINPPGNEKIIERVDK